MTTLHFVKKARKSRRGTGIKKGESYYWWQFAFSPKQYSKERPRRSQLTRSAFLGSIFDIEDSLGALTPDGGIEELKSARDDAVEQLRALAEEQEEKKSNMPDALQESDTGQLLDDRKTACETAADELEQIDLDGDKDDGETEEEWLQELIEELQGVSIET